MAVAPDVRPEAVASASRALSSLRAFWPWLVLAALLLLAFLLRVVDLTDNPRGFFTDEAAAGLDAHSILTSGKDMHGNTMPFLFRSLEDYKLPVFIYAQVPFVALFGLSEFAVRFTVVVFGTLTVLMTYLLARELFKSKEEATEGLSRVMAQAGPLAAAGLLAVLPWHIHYSRTGFGEMVSFPLLFTLGWFLFLRAGRRSTSLVPAAIVFALCFYTYRSGWVVLPPFLALMLLLYYRDVLRDRRDALIGAGVFAVVLLPLAYHLLWGEGDRASSAWIFNIDTDRSTLGLAWEQYRSYFTRSFLFEDADNGFLLRHYLPGQGVLLWGMEPLLLAGIMKLVLVRSRGDLLLLSLILLYPLSGALSDTSPISSRTILGAVVFALVAGAGFGAIVQLVADVPGQAGRWAIAGVTAVAILAVGLSTASYLQRYHDDYPAISAGYWGWQDGPQEIVDYFLAVQDEYDDLYLDGMFNAPHVFFPFYAGDACERCRIGGPDRYNPERRQLFALRVENPEVQRYWFELHEVLLYPDGSPSFFLLEIRGLR